MDHRDIRRELAGRLEALLSADDLPIQPRPYQREALLVTQQWLEDLGGSPRGNIVHATGLGKTLVFASLVSFCTGMRSLIIVPSKVLLEQTARFVVRFTGGIIGHLSSLSTIKNGDGDVIAVRGVNHSDIVITTDESFVRYAAAIARDFAPHFIVWDECHWAYGVKAQAALGLFPTAVVLGVTATPNFLGNSARGGFVPVTMDNGQTLYAAQNRMVTTHFGSTLDQRSIRWGVEEGWLCPLAWAYIDFDADLSALPLAEGPAGLDYREQDLQSLMERHWSAVVDAVRRIYLDGTDDLHNRQAFAICPSVRACRELAAAVDDIVPAASITGTTPNAERNAMLAAYARNEIKFIASVMVLREGWDAPNAEVCFMLRPTRSWVFYIQSVGRVLRPHPDGEFKAALVVDGLPTKTRITPLSAPILFGEPGSEVRVRDLLIKPRSRNGGNDAGNGHAADVVSPFLPDDAKPKLVYVDPLEIEYWAGADGSFEADEDVWSTPRAFATILGISTQAIRDRIEYHAAINRVRTRKGRGRNGVPQVFYALSDVRVACRDLLHPKESSSPYTKYEGLRWACATTLVYQYTAGFVKWAIRNGHGSIRSMIFRASNGKAVPFYCKEDVAREWDTYKALRNKFLQDVPS